MYQNIYYDRFNEMIHLWDDELGYNKFPYTKYAYIMAEDGQYTTLDGYKVKKTLDWSKEAEQMGMVYEYDVRPEMRTLIDLYGESDEPSKNHCIFNFDIEVAKEGKYSEPEDADNTIVSIAYWDSITQKYTCLILEPDTSISFHGIDFGGVDVKTYRTEKALLTKFLEVWRSTPITIVTGWNVLMYDMMYLYNRMVKILGKWEANSLSPINRVDNFVTRRGDRVFRVAGISILDYMMLYKEHTYKEQSSYSLEAISQYELDMGKVKYDKDLDHLKRTDPVKFIQYNVEDVALVNRLDDKLDFIEISRGTCHKGHVSYEDIFFTSRYMEGACLTETKRRGIISTSNSKDYSGMAEGAFVKVPTPGIYKWVYDLDLTSLYPSNIMSLNISPETKWGKVLNWDSDAFVRGESTDFEIFIIHQKVNKTYSCLEFKDFLKTNNLSVSANGIIYDLSEEGLIPSLLRVWFDERAEFRTIADTEHEKGNVEESKFYDRKQKIQKVLLNSLYGVLLLPIFRFYDKDNGEAVTSTGQQLIKFTTTMTDDYYNAELGTEDVGYCIYTDTDSVFYEAMPLINKWYGEVEEDDIPNLAIQVATKVQDYINKTYDIYAREFHMLETHRWNIKQELVANRAFWGSAKKRYAMWIVRDGNKVVDKPDIKGFDSVRSSFPKIYREFLEKLIINILHDNTARELNEHILEFKRELNSYDIRDIMNPTSVSDIGKWKGEHGSMYKKGTPIHVKSAINYNFKLKQLELNNFPNIHDGDKLLWTYLKDNPDGFDTMAIIGYDDPDEIIEYVEEYINRDKGFDKAMGNKLQSIWDDLGWGTIIMNPNVFKFFEFKEIV